MKPLLLAALLLAGCTQKPDKPSGWDAQQQLEILQLKDRVSALERDSRDQKITQDATINEIGNIENRLASRTFDK